MASAPLSGIVFVNNNISGSMQETLINQLFIDIVLTGDEFDAKVRDGYSDGYTDGYTDGYYLNNIKMNSQRVMVIRTFAQNDMVNNIPNRELADVILFVKNGLANVVTKDGHKPTFSVINLYWGVLGFH